MKVFPVTIETDDGVYVLRNLKEAQETALKTALNMKGCISREYILSLDAKHLVSFIVRATEAWNVVYSD